MLKQLLDDVYKYLTLRAGGVAHTFVGELSRLLAKLAVLAISVLFAFLILIFLSIAFGFGFGRWFGIGDTGGFFVLLGVYLLIALVLHLCRHRIRRAIHNRLIREYLDILKRYEDKSVEEDI